MKKMVLGGLAILILLAGFAMWLKNKDRVEISSGHMMPTLAVGDVVEIDRKAFSSRSPEVGELVVYKESESAPLSVGRIVGRGGDTLSFPGNKLEVNNQRTQVSSESVEIDLDGQLVKFEEAGENLGGYSYKVLYHPGLSQVTDEAFTLKEGEYFILGDHRSNSRDSRHFGAIPRSNIVAPLVKVVDSKDSRRIGKELGREL